MLEHFFQCLHCWSTISVLLDTSIHHTKYVEDCEVCCNPLEIEVTFEENELTSFNVSSLEQ